MQFFCPCSSGVEYEKCCKPFHDGALPENALQLMRSRYAAYVLDKPEYVMGTTHPASPEHIENKLAWKQSLSNFSKGSIFQKLEILDFKENGSAATVVFTASISQDGHDATFSEKSYFEKMGRKWLYKGGVLVSGHLPNLVTTKQLRLLPLAYYGDPILKKKADPVEEITEDLKKLVEEMIETMDAFDGCGIAAPQVHHGIRLFVIRSPISTKKDQVEWGEVKVFINPKLSEPSKETTKSEEGCLSIPTLRSYVTRPKEITVEYMSLDGKIIKERVFGLEARIVMHENDHINGVLFVDRLDLKEKAKIVPFLQKLEKRIGDGRAL